MIKTTGITLEIEVPVTGGTEVPEGHLDWFGTQVEKSIKEALKVRGIKHGQVRMRMIIDTDDI
jgi:hypothetical protein